LKKKILRFLAFLFIYAERLHRTNLPLCHNKKNRLIMGLFEFLLAGAVFNSLKNKRNSSDTRSDFSDNYSRGYNDGYEDGYMDNDYECDGLDDGYDW
jgi:hypothetical protein